MCVCVCYSAFVLQRFLASLKLLGWTYDAKHADLLVLCGLSSTEVSGALEDVKPVCSLCVQHISKNEARKDPHGRSKLWQSQILRSSKALHSLIIEEEFEKILQEGEGVNIHSSNV